MTDAAATVYFQLDARTSKFLAELNKAAAAWDRTHQKMARDARAASQAAKRSHDDINASVGRVGNSAGIMAETWKKAMGAMAAAATVAVAALGTREIIEYADTWIKTSNRLRLVTKDTADLAKKQTELFQVAQDTGEKYSATVNIYASLTQALATAGEQSEKTSDAVAALADAAEISGVEFSDVESKVIRMARGMADGTVSAKEFNAILLTVPRAASAIAEALGKPIEKVKELAKDGKLSAGQVVDALASQRSNLANEASGIVDDFSKVGVRINNELTRALGAPLSGVLSASAKIGQDAIIDLIHTAEQMPNTFALIGAVGVAAATAMAAAWRLFQGTLTGIETVLTFIEVKYRELSGEKPLESASQTLRDAYADAKRLNQQLEQFGDNPGNAEGIKRVKRELDQVNATINRLDPTGKLQGMIARYDELQSKIATASAQVFPGEKAVDTARTRLKLIENDIASIQSQIDKAGNSVTTELRERLAAAKGNKIRLELELENAQRAVQFGVTPVVEEVKRLQNEAKQLKKDMSGLGLDINAKGGLTALGEAQQRLDKLLQTMDELTNTATLLSPDDFIKKVKEMQAQLNAVKTDASTVLSGAPGAAAQSNIRLATPEQFQTGVGIGLARQKELDRAATVEVNRLILNGEHQFSDELKMILEQQVNAKVGADRVLAEQKAASQGKDFDPVSFDEATRKRDAYAAGFEALVNQIEAGRERIQSGGDLITLGMSEDQFALVIEQAQNLNAIVGENALKADEALSQALLDGKVVLGEKLLQLAIDQATAETIAAEEAKRAAAGELGVPLTAEEELERREKIHEAILAKVNSFQAKLGAAELRGAALRRKLALEEAKKKLETFELYSSQVVNVLTDLGGKSKALGRAAQAIQKGQALVSITISTAEAIMKAQAQLGPIAGSAATAALIALGAAQAAVVLGAGGSGAEGGAFSAAGGDVGANVPPLTGYEPQTEKQAAQQVVNIMFQGDLVGWDEVMQEHLLDTIRDAVDGRDIVLFSGTSRQADEIRGGG